MAITTNDLLNAAELVSSSPKTVTSGPGGVRDQVANWEKKKGQIARALLADPDIVLYTAFLASNRACAQAQVVTASIARLLPLIEGQGIISKQPDPRSTAALERTYARAAGRPYVDNGELQTLKKELDSYLEEEILPAIKVRTRHQPRAAEARAKYAAEKATLLEEWALLLRYLTQCRSTPKFPASRARTLAATLPLQNLGKTLDAGFSDEMATEYAVQLAAAAAAVQAMGREVDYRFRLVIQPGYRFPEGLDATALMSDGVVTQITFTRSPLELGVKSGDEVSWGAESAVVTAVLDSSILISSGITSPTGRLTVRHAAYGSLSSMVSAAAGVAAELPTVSRLMEKLTRWETGSAADIRNSIGYLADLYASLDAVDSESAKILARVDVELEERTPLVQTLKAYDPTFSPTTVRTAELLLEGLEEDGMDYAAELMAQGHYPRLLNLDAEDTSRLGRLSYVTSSLVQYTGGGGISGVG
jgi:hypothetical protein